MSAVRFSVVIPVRNRPAEIRRCVWGVRTCEYPEDRYEIIVVDNGSTDRTATEAERAGAWVVREPVANRCRARNLGVAAARGRWIVFLDSDCVPARGWLAALGRAVEAVESDGAGDRIAALAGPVRPAPPTTTVEAYIARRRWIDQEKFLAEGRRYSPPFAATANLTVRRDLYRGLGGLDPDLATAGEDADFCWRLAGEGWRLRYVPEAEVTHHHRATLGGLWCQAYHYGIGNAELFAKWRRQWGACCWIEPSHYIWALKASLKTPIQSWRGGNPLDRQTPLYDAMSNVAMALGRAVGGMRRGVLVL